MNKKSKKAQRKQIVEQYKLEQTAKLIAAGKDAQVEGLEDRVETLKAFALHGKVPTADTEGHGPGPGDLERAVLEWRSTLQLIAHGPARPSQRWQQLRAAAEDVLGRIVGPTPATR